MFILSKNIKAHAIMAVVSITTGMLERVLEEFEYRLDASKSFGILVVATFNINYI